MASYVPKTHAQLTHENEKAQLLDEFDQRVTELAGNDQGMLFCETLENEKLNTLRMKN